MGWYEALIKSSHVKRTRRAYEVSLSSLFLLRNETYSVDYSNISESHETWVSHRCKESTQFLYWQTTMELESHLLNFVCSTCEANFNLFVQILGFFALDLTHHSCWVPVFIKALEELQVWHPQVYDEFRKGHFTSRKTNARFSAISDDHLHEQNSKTIKGDGRAIFWSWFPIHSFRQFFARTYRFATIQNVTDKRQTDRQTDNTVYQKLDRWYGRPKTAILGNFWNLGAPVPNPLHRWGSNLVC